MTDKALSIDRLVQRQAHLFELRRKLQMPQPDERVQPFITISREFGCTGFRLGLALLAALNPGKMEEEQWAIYDRRVFEFIDGDAELNRRFFEEHVQRRNLEFEEYLNTTFGAAPSDLSLFNRWANAMRNLAQAGRAIFVGRASHLVTRDLLGGLHVRVMAPFEWRVAEHARANGLTETESRTLTRLKDRERREFLQRYFGAATEDVTGFHLVINNALVGEEEMVRLILSLLGLRKG
ncbi:MAG: cytidylate kinase-like family protein [bacterium]|jgi:cytidylate kinase|nr:cytidylate kinase-like family protein [bacterium]